MNEDPATNDTQTILSEERKELSFNAQRDSEKLSKLENMSLSEFVAQRAQLVLLFQNEDPVDFDNKEAMLLFIDTQDWSLAGVVELPRNWKERN